ncbi:MAG: copper homeostasis protein CutC [Gemmobacter sp.]|uniref:copper homeostasis protein CutC n=1 Tax=Gemmobacter sp. TaxID=1898957 RepID=UPI001A5BAEB7|nr:copper homeostasis protein CutC [Gemmobacter sp.]MBL8562124.1 copper homeostasis protein CutC [Gemmobacter sp.]
MIEVCVDTLAGLEAALAGGAGRIELCAALDLGGLTPSAGLMRAAAGCGLPVLAMMRPRAGGFVWSAAEQAAICDDIAAARAAGLAGVVLGASLPDGRLDRAALARMTAAASGMQMTLHRCFDLVPDPAMALETAIELGFHRVLTSGGALRAAEGLARLQALQAQAAGRIGILPGSGISAANAPLFAAFPELHASCSAAGQGELGRGAAELVRFGFSAVAPRETRADLVADLVQASGS